MASINAYQAACIFMAVRIHFTSDSYDYFKYNGKVNLSVDAFEAKRDKYTFHKLAKKYKEEEYLDFIVANIMKNPKVYSRELLSEDCDYLFKVYQKRIQSLSYTFSEEIGKLLDFVATKNKTLDDLLMVPPNGIPLLLDLYYQKEISLETLTILERVLSFFKVWDKKITDTIIWPSTKRTCLKYTPFLHIDDTKFKTILKEKINGT